MPRRQFIADLQQTKQEPLPPGIDGLVPGEDDGQIIFTYSSTTGESTAITAMIPDVSDYPSEHSYILYCDDAAAKSIANRVQKLPNTDGLSITQLLDVVSNELRNAETTSSKDATDTGASDEDFDDEMLVDDESDDDFMTEIVSKKGSHLTASPSLKVHLDTTPAFRNRVRKDLQYVKDAGFRIYVLGNILGGAACYISIAIRFAKLGISEEAMEAWQVNPANYLILTIYYPGGYKTDEQLEMSWSSPFQARCLMRVSTSHSSKPHAQDVIAAFQSTGKDEPTHNEQGSTLQDTFISRSLIGLLQDHLVPILMSRDPGMNWQGAELYWRDQREADSKGPKPVRLSARYTTHEVTNSALPPIISADHFASHIKAYRSFPLVAMQFMLRHFVRCTEFCLVCHNKIDNNGLEAIKPYVCDRPLCLYQYMTLGFGPSIEHEIQSQPYVVDLLISFCYVAAQCKRLKDFPVGLDMRVPDPAWTVRKDNPNAALSPSYGYVSGSAMKVQATVYSAEYDINRNELKFGADWTGACPVSKGSWIVMSRKSQDKFQRHELHCRVLETAFFPLLTLDVPVEFAAKQHPHAVPQPRKQKNVPVTPAATPRWEAVTFVRYDQSFDELDDVQRSAALCRMLDILPPVSEMQTFLKSNSTPDLKKWTQRIPPAALSLLRWIIASNRACIMQVDCMDDSLENKTKFRQERITGMDSYLQFRFAMGAPDKEQRFMSAVKSTAERLKLVYPTIFAWHGSPLFNWHGIIREGLHFKNTDHGRAYGHGVYHAKEAHTSLGYSGGMGRYYYQDSDQYWPNSMLKVNTALALNELVNAPQEYVSSQPFYVVNQLDWIQTRYLLVHAQGVTPSPSTKCANPHSQDPARTPMGVGNLAVSIPAAAIKTGRSHKHDAKKQKGAHGNPIKIDIDDDYSSEGSDEETDKLLKPEMIQGLALSLKKPVNSEDFVPGTIEWKSLPLLPTPVYATSATTKRIMTELQSMRKLLTTPAEELGWYIDFDNIDNVYQWIVELHSFHKFEVKGKRLPLADELKARDMKSVVMEIRFGKDFPFSPPYVRVVRPRFKTFAEGGGGHIVMGGAMCMELLTNTGWSSVNTIESVLLQVRLAIASEPFARLDNRTRGDYGAGEAAEGFIRACRTHGWAEPPGFREIAYGSSGPRF